MKIDPQPGEDIRPDFIIVGSGAGGGPLAARLADQGFLVLLIEAGSDHARVPDANGATPAETPEERDARLKALEVSLVPSLHGVSTEYPDLSWQFFVDHYTNPPGEDPKWTKPDNQRGAPPGKVFYPRASALGGCTVHNAMITIAGPDSDWDDLADFLKDRSWSGRSMRRYFQRLEHNGYIDPPEKIPTGWLKGAWHDLRWLLNCGWPSWLRPPDYTAGRHGFNGWLHTSVADISIGLKDKQLIKMLKSALWKAIFSDVDKGWTFVKRFLEGRISEELDPNHSRTQAENPEGAVLVPIAVCGPKTDMTQNAATPFVQKGRRSSPREFLLEVKARRPDRLIIWTECFVTRVVFEKDASSEKPRATGVEFLRGGKLYAAHQESSKDLPRTPGKVFTRENGEVILCGGSFNTPQLLTLSGIGRAEEIEKWKIQGPRDVRGNEVCPPIKAAGVGKNLQDRYEVSVISEMRQEFSLLQGATFSVPQTPDGADAPLREWRKEGTGLYTSNGAVLGILKRSNPDLSQPDLFIFGVPLPFRGYELDYSKIGDQHQRFTWAILKGHTKNHQGVVSLASPEPLDRPNINFHYFNEGVPGFDPDQDPDLIALLDGVKFVRGISTIAQFPWLDLPFLKGVKQENYPGRTEIGSDQQIKDWIRRIAWGHHACGTCRMGPDDDAEAVLDTDFNVRGVSGLRVVDASIFPKIPGYFIVTNIYMASEKAYDVVSEDALRRGLRPVPMPTGAAPDGDIVNEAALPDRETYPSALRWKELLALRERREHLHKLVGEIKFDWPDGGNPIKEPPKPNPESTTPVEPPVQNTAGKKPKKGAGTIAAPETSGAAASSTPPPDTGAIGDWTSNVTGLGLSGGGIRSATFNLGILQGLARGRALRYIDFLSTVSGGGYIGGYIGRFFDHLRNDTFIGNPDISAAGPVRVEDELIDPNSQQIAWLRKHGNYISPAGEGNQRLNVATFLRNFVTMHFVVGTFIFALFGIANALRYGVFEETAAVADLGGFSGANLPLGHLLSAVLGPFFSPWFVLFELLILFLVLPQMVGYWLASQDHHGRFQGPPLALLFLIGGLLLFAGVYNGFAVAPLVLSVALFTSLAHVEWAWAKGRRREEAIGTGGTETQRLRTRNILTQDLGLSVGLAGIALGFALIDTIGHGLQQKLIEHSVTYTKAFASFAAALTVLTPVAHAAARFFSGEKKGGGPPSSFVKAIKGQIAAAAMAAVLFTVPLVLYSFTSHAIFQGGADVRAGVLATVLALLISLILSNRKAITVVNRSALAPTYAARLARAYLGASNPDRRRPEGANVTEVIGGDDVPTMPDYRPFEGGGPLHLINVTINQTVDFTSQRGNRDRKGDNMAVSTLGLSVGPQYHALWKAPTPAKSEEGRRHPVPLQAVGVSASGEHPLVDASGQAAQRAEMLSLRTWIGISGAAVSPGSGATTEPGTALLLGMGNLRLGQWWDSSITEASREGFPALSFLRRFLYLLPHIFRTQTMFLWEWIARFHGPWERYWFISDGGFFENLATYELIRRRVPRIIVGDGTADPQYQFDELANLILKARLDFDADIVPFTAQELNDHVFQPVAGAPPSPLQDVLGTLDDMRPKLDGDGIIVTKSKKHAALFWVKYTGGKTPARRSVLLYIKATLTGDEDPALDHYATTHPDFPNESTGDQFFNEAQWENYRALGDHSATPLFKDPAWFWKIPLPIDQPER
jgi:choline dehydrogenase-like flavoprotein